MGSQSALVGWNEMIENGLYQKKKIYNKKIKNKIKEIMKIWYTTG